MGTCLTGLAQVKYCPLAPSKRTASHAEKTLVLHIGAPKTGSTSIQAFLRRNSQLLRRKYSIDYPEFFRVAKLRAFQAYLTYPRIGFRTKAVVGPLLRDPEEFNAQFLDDFRQTVLSSPCQTLVFSSELVCSLKPAHVRRFASLTDDLFTKIRVVLYIRRQDLLELSAYLQAFKSGNQDSIGFQAPFVIRRPGFRTVIETWSEVFGENSVEVRIYERDRLPQGDVVHDFMSTLGVEDLSAFKLEEERNYTWGQRQVALATLLNRNFYSLSTDFSVAQTLRKDDIFEFVQTFDNHPKFMPSRSEAEAFFATFREENEWIRARYFSDQLTLFDENFDQYPEHGSCMDLSREDLEEVVLKLWEFRSSNPATPQVRKERTNKPRKRATKFLKQVLGRVGRKRQS